MGVLVQCECGGSYTVRDEFAGQLLQCPACGRQIQADAAETRPQLDAAFERDRFLLRQKRIAIAEKYDVADEENRPVLFLERPRHLLVNVLALLGGIVAAVIVLGLFTSLASAAALAEGTAGFLILAGAIASFVVLIVVASVLSKKRHLTFYRDATKRERLLEVLQDRTLQFLNATYTVRAADGATLAKLRKNYLYNLIRKRWYCTAPDGRRLCVAKEDSVILSLLRRFLGNFFGLLRTNFVLVGQGERVIGEFNRKFSVFDRYVLDLSADPARTLDRRVALALGVMLDTGERR